MWNGNKDEQGWMRFSLNFISAFRLADSRLRTCRKIEGSLELSRASQHHTVDIWGPVNLAVVAALCVEDVQQRPWPRPLRRQGWPPSDSQKCLQVLPDVPWGQNPFYPLRTTRVKERYNLWKGGKGIGMGNRKEVRYNFLYPSHMRASKMKRKNTKLS